MFRIRPSTLPESLKYLLDPLIKMDYNFGINLDKSATLNQKLA